MVICHHVLGENTLAMEVRGRGELLASRWTESRETDRSEE